MAEAGYPDGGISITLTYASGAPYEQIATIIQANLADIALTLTPGVREHRNLKIHLCRRQSGTVPVEMERGIKVDFVYRDLFYIDVPVPTIITIPILRQMRPVDIVSTRKRSVDKRPLRPQRFRRPAPGGYCPQVSDYTLQTW